MYKLFLSRKGSSEIIAIFLILPLFLLPLWDGFYMFSDMKRYDVLNQAARQALLNGVARWAYPCRL
jgi:hypothetical protein